MGLTVLPTKTDASLGREKTDRPARFPLSVDLRYDVPATEYERIKQAIVDIANTIGLQDGSTAGSIEARLDALESGGAPGDVIGPAASTDNAIARFDGVTGKLLQNSLVTIDDLGNLDAPGIFVDRITVMIDGTAGNPAIVRDGTIDTGIFFVAASDWVELVSSGASGANKSEVRAAPGQVFLGVAAGSLSVDNSIAAILASMTLRPSVDSTTDLGTNAIRWRTAYLDRLITADCGADFVPDASSVRSLGAAAARWLSTWSEMLQMQESGAAPSTVANVGSLYTRDDGGFTELHYKDSAGVETQLSRTRIKLISTTTYTLLDADHGYALLFDHASGCAVTVPASWRKGSACTLTAIGGQVTLVEGGTLSLIGPTGATLATRVAGSTIAVLLADSTASAEVALVSGDLA